MVLTLLPLAFGLKDESLVVITPSKQCDYSFVKPTPDMNQLSVFMSSAFYFYLPICYQYSGTPPYGHSWSAETHIFHNADSIYCPKSTFNIVMNFSMWTVYTHTKLWWVWWLGVFQTFLNRYMASSHSSGINQLLQVPEVGLMTIQVIDAGCFKAMATPLVHPLFCDQNYFFITASLPKLRENRCYSTKPFMNYFCCFFCSSHIVLINRKDEVFTKSKHLLPFVRLHPTAPNIARSHQSNPVGTQMLLAHFYALISGCKEWCFWKNILFISYPSWGKPLALLFLLAYFHRIFFPDYDIHHMFQYVLQ